MTILYAIQFDVEILYMLLVKCEKVRQVEKRKKEEDGQRKEKRAEEKRRWKR